MRGATAQGIGGRYDLELAVLDELPGWTLHDVWGAPADFITELLYRRSVKHHWQGEAKRLKADLQRQREAVSSGH